MCNSVVCSTFNVKCSWDGLHEGRNCSCIWSFWCSGVHIVFLKYCYIKHTRAHARTRTHAHTHTHTHTSKMYEKWLHFFHAVTLKIKDADCGLNFLPEHYVTVSIVLLLWDSHGCERDTMTLYFVCVSATFEWHLAKYLFPKKSLSLF